MPRKAPLAPEARAVHLPGPVFRDRLRSVLDRLGLPARGPVVVGASGGVDSTVLWRSLHALGVPTVGVHVDYGLREASGEDAAFVSALGAAMGIPVHVREVTLGDGNRQEAAREARYAVFREIAEASGAEVVAVGHTASDQAETVLHNLIRGSGLAGLAGMRESRPLAPEADVRLMRPLLGFPRAEVEAEARARAWEWREDASNATDAYRRNRLRTHVLPLLEEEGGPETVLRIAAAARSARVASGETVDRLVRVGQPDARGGAVPLASLLVLTEPERRALVAEMLRAWAPEAPRSEALVSRIAGLMEAEVGARIVAGPVEVWRERQRLVVARCAPEWGGCAVAPAGTVQTPFGTLVLEPLASVPSAFPSSRDHEIADAEALAKPLALRPWRQGDRIRPLGLGGSRLVSGVLTDARVPPSTRRQRLVLASGETVLWVVGLRLAESARVTDATERAVSLRWTPQSP